MAVFIRASPKILNDALYNIKMAKALAILEAALPLLWYIKKFASIDPPLLFGNVP